MAENDGSQQFNFHEIPGAPAQLAAVAASRSAAGLSIYTGSFTVSAATQADQRLLVFRTALGPR